MFTMLVVILALILVATAPSTFPPTPGRVAQSVAWLLACVLLALVAAGVVSFGRAI